MIVLGPPTSLPTCPSAGRGEIAGAVPLPWGGLHFSDYCMSDNCLWSRRAGFRFTSLESGHPTATVREGRPPQTGSRRAFAGGTGRQGGPAPHLHQPSGTGPADAV